MTNTAPDAGWYPAPGEPGLHRYWDGSAWGADRRPAPPAAAVSTAPGGLTIAGFVVALVALLLTVLGGGVIPGIIAAVLLAIGGRRGSSALGRAGLVIAIIAIVLSAVIVFVRVANSGA